MAPKAIAEANRLVYRHWSVDHHQGLQDTDNPQDLFVTSADAADGTRSFGEERAPRYERIGRTSKAGRR
ncbi:MAG: hypothetical protein AAF513_04565 [Pseudomonadota bacterium]